MLYLLTLLVTYITQGHGFGSGAPFGLCLSMYPHHGHKHQETPSPFNIRINRATYIPSEELTAVIQADDGTMFKGIEMRVHRVNGNTEAILGQFTDIPIDKLQTQNCYFGKNNLITHKNDEDVKSLTIKWRAPAENVGDIVFVATIVHNFTTFWHDVEVVVKSASGDHMIKADYQLPTYNSSFLPITWSSCGNTKGCFFHPPSCLGADCTAAVTYKQNSDDTYTFEMFGPSIDGTGWVGVAVSSDKEMGGDQAFLCAVPTDHVEVQFSFNPDTWNVQELTQGFSFVETCLMDGKIYCRFTRTKLSRFDHNGEMNFDLSQFSYLHLAWGKTIDNLGEAIKHIEQPAITYSKVQLNDYKIHTVEKFISGASGPHYYLFFTILFVILCSLL